jgi:predicted acetyltransferase
VIELAKDSQKEEMARLWQLCFGDPPEYIDHFFEHKFDPSRTLVYRADQRIVSAVYMLPAFICLEGRHEPVQYIYAVCTHPDYRKRGVMGRMMENACERAAEAGQRFSALLPASDPLYDYYGRLSYRAFFKRRRIECSMKALKPSWAPDFRILDAAPERIYRIRMKTFGRREGCLLWDKDAVAFALSAHQLAGGRVWCFEDQQREGYVMGYVARETAVIQELGIDPGLWPAAAQIIADYFSAPGVQLSVPGDLDILSGWGQMERWGMIRPLDEKAEALCAEREGVAPYLGLALD